MLFCQMDLILLYLSLKAFPFYMIVYLSMEEMLFVFLVQFNKEIVAATNTKQELK